MIIIADDKIPFLRGVFEPYAEVKYLSGPQTTAEQLRDASALITRTRTKCDRELLEGSSLRIIASATIGFDHIDTAYCEDHGIIWRNAPGCNSSSVMQYIGSALTELSLRLGFSLEDKTLGVVGVGNVGSKVAALAEIFGMKVLLCDPPKAVGVSLEDIISDSDIISLHVPLNSETYHLIDSSRLSGMRDNQILINSSRGEVVDNSALKSALRSKALAAAVLDVWEGEPEIDRELMELLSFATPHIAGYSADGKANGTVMAVREVAEALGIDELKGWTADCALAPMQPSGSKLEMDLDCSGKTKAEVLKEALRLTYDISEDDSRLRNSPELFEKLRGDYPLRREYTAYGLRLHNADEELRRSLETIGFTLL